MRRILAVHQSAELYGSDRVFLVAMHALVLRGARVKVLLPEHGPLIDKLGELGVEVTICNVGKLKSADLSGFRLIRGLLSVLNSNFLVWMEARKCQAEVIYVSTSVVFGWLLAGIFREVVWHVHEIGRTGAQRLLIRAVLIFSRAKVIFNSVATEELTCGHAKRFLSGFRTIHNCVAADELLAVSNRPAHGFAGRSFRLGYVGRISPRKGLHIAVQAIAILRSQGVDVTLTVFGGLASDASDYFRELSETLDRLGLQEHVFFAGERIGLFSIYESLDAVVIPSVEPESFGLVVAEGMWLGIPVVVSRVGALPEVLGDGFSWLTFGVGNSEQAASVVGVLINELRAGRRVGEMLQMRARNRYSPERFMADIGDLVLNA